MAHYDLQFSSPSTSPDALFSASWRSAGFLNSPPDKHDGNDEPGQWMMPVAALAKTPKWLWYLLDSCATLFLAGFFEFSAIYRDTRTAQTDISI